MMTQNISVGVSDTTKKHIETMSGRICEVLSDYSPSVYLIGSYVKGDFRAGWSDIDILTLTDRPITRDKASELLYLRQHLSSRNRVHDTMRIFEGGFLSSEAFVSEKADTVVYWGASGERITRRYVLSAMSMIDLLDNGILLSGYDLRGKIKRPTPEKLRKDMKIYYKNHLAVGNMHHKVVARAHHQAEKTLSIARCLYTLETGRVVSKTVAGEISIEMKWCPDTEMMRRMLEVRKNPDVYLSDETVIKWLLAQSSSIEPFAKMLEDRLCINSGEC